MQLNITKLNSFNFNWTTKHVTLLDMTSSDSPMIDPSIFHVQFMIKLLNWLKICRNILWIYVYNARANEIYMIYMYDVDDIKTNWRCWFLGFVPLSWTDILNVCQIYPRKLLKSLVPMTLGFQVMVKPGLLHTNPKRQSHQDFGF